MRSAANSPEAGGTRGFIVFHAEEGDALTLEDRATIARAVWSTEGHGGVVDKSACLAAQQQFDAIGQRLGDLQGGSDSRGDRCLST